MDILVTGDVGFIGGHLAETFVEEDHNVTVLDSYEPYYDLGIKEYSVETARKAAKNSNGSYDIIDGSVTNKDLVNELTKEYRRYLPPSGPSGRPHERRGIGEGQRVQRHGNGERPRSRPDHDVDRVVYASSSGVYGKPEYLLYDENHPNEPVSPYGVSKLAETQFATGSKNPCIYATIY